MAKKGFGVLGDFNNVESGYETIDDGDYTVVGVESVFSTDKNGYPVFVDQNGRDVARIRFLLEDGSTGPAFSGTKPELVLLAGLFGVDVRQLRGKEGTSFLSTFQTITAEAPNKLNVTSKDGWVNLDLLPPENLYTVRFVGAHRPDRGDGLLWQPGEYGETLIFDFEIAGDVLGRPSLYDEYRFGVFVRNPFAEPKNGQPRFKLTDKGATPVDTARMMKFVQMFCPNMLDEYEWESDPLESVYGTDETANPQIPIIHAARKQKKTAIVKLNHKTTKAGRKVINMDLQDLTTAEPDAVDYTDTPTQPAELLDLITYIETRWPDEEIFDQSSDDDGVIFTEAGKQWASEYLTAPWKTAGLPARNRKLASLTNEQVGTLLRELKSLYGEIDQPEESEAPNW